MPPKCPVQYKLHSDFVVDESTKSVGTYTPAFPLPLR